jgi:hypothetical protein
MPRTPVSIRLTLDRSQSRSLAGSSRVSGVFAAAPQRGADQSPPDRRFSHGSSPSTVLGSCPGGEAASRRVPRGDADGPGRTTGRPGRQDVFPRRKKERAGEAGTINAAMGKDLCRPGQAKRPPGLRPGPEVAHADQPGRPATRMSASAIRNPAAGPMRPRIKSPLHRVPGGCRLVPRRDGQCQEVRADVQPCMKPLLGSAGCCRAVSGHPSKHGANIERSAPRTAHALDI